MRRAKTLPNTVAGVVAKNDQAGRRLREHPLQALPPGFPRDRREWWIDPTGAAALHRARVIDDRHGRTIAFAADAGPRATEDLTETVARLSTSGATCLAEVQGGLALAIWDAERKQLRIVRDLFGQKRVYLREDRDFLTFSSDLELLIRGGTSHVSLDVASAVSYLLRGHPIPGQTLAHGVRTVPAAHMYEFNYGSGYGDSIRYWTPLTPLPVRSRRKSILPILNDVLRKAVASAYTGDDAAVLLSGGLDSSLIACVASTMSKAPPCALTLSAEPLADDDVRYATMVSRELGMRHIVVPMRAEEATLLLPNVLAAPAPMSAWTALSHMKLASTISEHGFQVVLSGMGADELFGGYDRFLDYFYRQRRFSRAWRSRDWFDILLHDANNAPATLFPGVASFFDFDALAAALTTTAARLTLLGDAEFYRECRRLSPEANGFALMGAHEIQHRIPDLLLETFEAVARQHPFAFAYPFLDRSIANIAMSLLPDEQFWFERGAWWAKRTLRRLARGIVPGPVVMRPRTAYDVPIAIWLRDPTFGKLVTERIADSTLWRSGLFRRGSRNRAVKEVAAASRTHGCTAGACGRTWALLTLGAWHDRYVSSA